MELSVEQWKKIVEAWHKIANIVQETEGLTYNITATTAPPDGFNPEYGVDTATELTVFVDGELPDDWV